MMLSVRLATMLMILLATLKLNPWFILWSFFLLMSYLNLLNPPPDLSCWPLFYQDFSTPHLSSTDFFKISFSFLSRFSSITLIKNWGPKVTFLLCFSLLIVIVVVEFEFLIWMCLSESESASVKILCQIRHWKMLVTKECKYPEKGSWILHRISSLNQCYMH